MADPLRCLVLLLLLLQQLQMVPSFNFNITMDQVLAEDSGDRIVSLQYWNKFREFMNQLNEADFDNRTEMLTIPDISEFLVPAELLSAVSASLNSSSWLRQLDAEYINDGEHNMTLLIGMLEHLGNVANQRQVTVPQEVLKKFLWRGLIRPEQQGTFGVWLRSALDTFFASRQAIALQRDQPTLFVKYILGVFEFDWMPAREVLEATLANFRLQDELAAEAGQAMRIQRQQPDDELPGWDEEEATAGQLSMPAAGGDGDGGSDGWFAPEKSMEEKRVFEDKDENGMGKWEADNGGEEQEQEEEGTAEDWTGENFEEADFGEEG